MSPAPCEKPSSTMPPVIMAMISVPMQRAEDRAAAAGQRGAADDHRADHAELEAGAGGRLGDAQVAEQQRRGEAAEPAGQGEGDELDPVGIDAGSRAPPRGCRRSRRA